MKTDDPLQIIITGTSSGIGRALAQSLMLSGHQVWGIARTPQKNDACNGKGLFRSSQCDVSSWDALNAVAEIVSREWGKVDAVIACAGSHGEIGQALAASLMAWSETIQSNLVGSFFTVRSFYPLLQKAARRAKVVCFSGGGATKARPYFSAYGVAKTGIVRLVETIAIEEKGKPFDINAVAPGAINTRLTDEIIARGASVVGESEYQATVKQKQNGGASIEKLQKLIDWLLSSASDGITGRLISAQWDNWASFGKNSSSLSTESDIYTLRRILPEERGMRM